MDWGYNVWLEDLFEVDKPLIGMVHLKPLPESPNYEGDISSVIEGSLRDARAIEEGGFDGIIVENFWDLPLTRGRVGPGVVSAMTLAVTEIRREISLPVGVDVLRSDCVSAAAIAHVTGAQFIRCNAYTDTLVTDQGIIQPKAWDVMREIRLLGKRDVRIMADVLCKHAKPLVNLEVGEAARAAVLRGMADAVVVTGTSTGSPPSVSSVRDTKNSVPNVPVIVGSGLDSSNIHQLLRIADGAIVGTWIKMNGEIKMPVSSERVKRIVEAVEGIRKS